MNEKGNVKQVSAIANIIHVAGQAKHYICYQNYKQLSFYPNLKSKWNPKFTKRGGELRYALL